MRRKKKETESKKEITENKEQVQKQGKSNKKGQPDKKEKVEKQEKVESQEKKRRKLFQKNKSRDIRSIIARPILFLVISFALLIFILFNLVLLYTLDSSLTHALKTARLTIEQYQSEEKAFTVDTLWEYCNRFALYQEKSIPITFALVDKDGNLRKTTDSDVKDQFEVVNKATEQGLSEGDVGRIQISNDKWYYVITYEPQEGTECLYFIASTETVREGLDASNQALITILSSLTILLLFVSYAIATHVTEPIKHLSEQAERIGEGTFVVEDIKSNCKELQKLQQSVRVMVERLDAYHDAQKMSLQNVSHEMRTPLMSIQGYAEGLKCGYFDVDSEAPDIIIEESKRLSAIVDQILLLSKLDTYNQPLSIQCYDLAERIDCYLKELEGYAYTKQIQLCTTYAKHKIMISTDDELLRNILVNIIANGIRYAKTKVSITTEQTDEKISIIVCDDGDGLSEEEIPFIFARFYKGAKGKYGLGLAMAKAAAQYLGGDIEASNTASHGAKFTVTFPTHYTKRKNETLSFR